MMMLDECELLESTECSVVDAVVIRVSCQSSKWSVYVPL